jgi:trimethylamine:corrinoid methyltransferase-like protein
MKMKAAGAEVDESGERVRNDRAASVCGKGGTL